MARLSLETFGTTKLDVLALLIVLVAVRALFVAAALDPSEERLVDVLDAIGTSDAQRVAVTGDTAGLPTRPLFDREELYTATAAQAIRLGVDIPIGKYQFMSYGGGSFVLSLLIVPLYALCGPSYQALKLIGLTTSVLGGLLWFLLVRRWFGVNVARVFFALYLFAPITFVRTSLIAKGDHAEAMTWAGLVLVLVTRTIDAGTNGPRSRMIWAAAAGLAAGFGIYLTYSTLPILIGVVAVLAGRTRLRPAHVWASGAAGLFVGLGPWVANLLRSRGAALRIYDRSILDPGWDGPADALARLRELADGGFFAGYDLGAFDPILRLLFLVAAALGLFVLSMRAAGRLPPTDGEQSAQRRWAAWSAGAGIVAFLGAFAIAAPEATSRYVLPVLPLLLVSIAGLVAERWTRRLGWALCAALVLAGAAAQVTVLTASDYRALRTPLRGTDWPLLGEVVGQNLSVESVNALPPNIGRFFALGMGKKIYYTVASERWEEAVGLLDPDIRLAVWEGMGIASFERQAPLLSGEFLDAMPDSARTAMAVGANRYSDQRIVPLLISTRARDLRRLEEPLAPWSTRELRTSILRITGVLATRSRVGADAVAFLSDDDRATALAWAVVYSAAGGSHRPRRRLPSGAPQSSAELARQFEDLAEGHAPASAVDAAAWPGIVAVAAHDWSALEPRWLLETAGPEVWPDWLAAVPAAEARAFYHAFGSVCGFAASSPEVAGFQADRPNDAAQVTQRILATAPWAVALPPEMRDAFSSGVTGIRGVSYLPGP